MINSSFDVYKTVRESEMDAKWCNDCVTVLRRDWRQLVNPVTNAINKNYLFSSQNMAETIALFKERGDFLKIRQNILSPLPIFENIKNLFIEEITKNPPKVELTATDPQASLDRQYDINLFKLKGRHERAMNQINAKIGNPTTHKIGKDKFKGSMEGFDNMELDPNDPDDQTFFSQNNRMKYEIAGQSLVNNIMKLGRFDKDTIEDFVIDILSDKVEVMDVYVDKITGEIKHDYIYPETLFGLFGKRSDGSDDVCRGWEKPVTVNEFLQRVGNNFIWDRDWKKLLWAINYRSNQVYTGFVVNNVRFDCAGAGNQTLAAEAGIPAGAKSNLIQWTLAYTYEIYMGKISWKVPQVTSNYKYKPEDQNVTPASMPNDYQITEQDEVEGYQLKSYYQQQTYEAYYISTSAVSQWIYGWGKTYHQLLHGANDEFSDHTIQYYRKRGLSAVELAMPYIKLANDAFYKMVWAVYEAHPDWEVYQVEELTALAKVMYSQAASTTGNAKPNDVQSQLTKLIKYFRDNLVKLKAIPRVDGKPQVGLNNTPVKEHRGLDPIAIAMQAVTTWAETQIMQKLGINDLRQGNIANAREGFKQNELETKFSMNVTGYVYRMIQYMKERIATTDLLLAQDIIKFGNVNGNESIPYKWIKKIVGQDNFEGLKSIQDFAAHRYGIIVTDENVALDKQKILSAADMSLDKGDGRGGLSFDEWFMVTQVEDFKQAAKLLTYMKLKASKKKRKEELETLKIQHDNTMAEKAEDKEIENIKQQGELAKTKMVTETQRYVVDKTVEGKIDVKAMTNEAETPKQDAKANANKSILQEKANLEQQKAIPA